MDPEITVADWDSMGRVITQTRGRAFQTLGRAFETIIENQKLGREFDKFGRVFVLQHGPCCPNQPRYEMVKNLIESKSLFKASMTFRNLGFDADKAAQYSAGREKMAAIYWDHETLFGSTEAPN